MSLLEEFEETFEIIDRKIIDDGAGGNDDEWIPGAEFKGVLSSGGTLQTQIAFALKDTLTFTLNVSRSWTLKYHDVFRRKKTGEIFRITSDDEMKKTPPSSSLDINQYTCERWELT